MKAIFIRGVPGTGKTIVSKKIKEKLSNSEIICVDNFKLKAMKKGKGFEESQKIAYEKTLEKLYSLSPQDCVYIILEELICEKDFLKSLIEFLHKTKSQAYWFRLLRPIEKLLEVESYRTRKIKNTQEDLFKLKQQLDDLKIPREIFIKNDNLALTIKKILDVVI